MRLLISCPQCHRRYDASTQTPGTKFRCRCGDVLEVRQPKGHTASVVRCSSCGGARSDNARYCPFCRSDFTLHERDLHTVCPECFARVSDRAQYCPQCAAVLSGEEVAGQTTSANCPQCPDEQPLVSRRLGRQNLSLLECQMCAGLWISIESFNELRRRLQQQLAVPDDALQGTPDPRRLRRQSGPLYRKCVRCSRLMSRRQFAAGSGVIIDACRDHGIWFDPEELHQVVTWISEGGRSDNPLTSPPEPSISDSGPERSGHEQPARTFWITSGDDFVDALLKGLFGSLW